MLRPTGGRIMAVHVASAVGSTLLVLATYLLGAAAFSRVAGLVAALLFAVERDALWWSVEGFRDDTFALFVVLERLSRWCASWSGRARRARSSRACCSAPPASPASPRSRSSCPRCSWLLSDAARTPACDGGASGSRPPPAGRGRPVPADLRARVRRPVLLRELPHEVLPVALRASSSSRRWAGSTTCARAHRSRAGGDGAARAHRRTRSRTSGAASTRSAPGRRCRSRCCRWRGSRSSRSAGGPAAAGRAADVAPAVRVHLAHPGRRRVALHDARLPVLPAGGGARARDRRVVRRSAARHENRRASSSPGRAQPGAATASSSP